MQWCVSENTVVIGQFGIAWTNEMRVDTAHVWWENMRSATTNENASWHWKRLREWQLDSWVNYVFTQHLPFLVCCRHHTVECGLSSSGRYRRLGAVVVVHWEWEKHRRMSPPVWRWSLWRGTIDGCPLELNSQEIDALESMDKWYRCDQAVSIIWSRG